MIARRLTASAFLLCATLLSLAGCASDGGNALADVTSDSRSDAAGDTAVPDGSCDPLGADGCPDGQTCAYNPDDDAPLCVLRGELGPGAPCGGEAGSCDHGICLDLNDTAQLCYEFCGKDEDCGADVDCLQLDNQPYAVCRIDGIYQTCELLSPDACGEGKGCYATMEDTSPICLPGGTAGEGEPCNGTANECQAGFACVDTKCARLCDKKAGATCAVGTCKPYLPDLSDVGVCLE